MLNISSIKHSLKILFTTYLFFSLSLASFFVTIFISLGINFNSDEFFQLTNSFYKKSSQEAFIAVFKNNDIKNYQQQQKDYLSFQEALSKFNNEKSLFEKSHKNNIFTKTFNKDIILEPLDLIPLVIPLQEYHKNENLYSMTLINGLAFNHDKNISCNFKYFDKEKIQESTCQILNSFSILKNTYKTKYKILTPKQIELSKKEKKSDKSNKKIEIISAPTPFQLLNNFQPVIEKNIIFGNIKLLTLIGFSIAILAILIISIFQIKHSSSIKKA